MNELIIVRGLPGSGKSTFSSKFAAIGWDHFEADMYFGTPYVFDPKKLPAAHEWCKESVREALKKNNVVVSNTFSRIWEMEPYLNMDAKVTVITCEGNFGNVHGVPDYVVKAMRDRWEIYGE